MTATVTRVVRVLGSSHCHVATVPAALLEGFTFLRSGFVGVALPIVTRCGAELRGSAAVCMAPGTRVSCPRCRRITGIDRAADGNNEAPTVPAGGVA